VVCIIAPPRKDWGLGEGKEHIAYFHFNWLFNNALKIENIRVSNDRTIDELRIWNEVVVA
jgi:hypothetical protein